MSWMSWMEKILDANSPEELEEILDGILHDDTVDQNTLISNLRNGLAKLIAKIDDEIFQINQITSLNIRNFSAEDVIDNEEPNYTQDERNNNPDGEPDDLAPRHQNNEL